jgi:hypothetical protein
MQVSRLEGNKTKLQIGKLTCGFQFGVEFTTAIINKMPSALSAGGAMLH